MRAQHSTLPDPYRTLGAYVVESSFHTTVPWLSKSGRIVKNVQYAIITWFGKNQKL